MKIRWLLTGLGLMLIAIFSAAPMVRAQSVDEKIKNLEQEIADLKSQQIEMKKDAAAAAAALPTFVYRPANGALIEAADKSWGLRFSLESHFRMEFENGRPQAGRTSGEVFGRRFRPYINYCLQDCLYETEVGWDLDGWSTNSGLQRGVVYVHFERLNPWMPRLEFGMDMTGIPVIPYRQGGSSLTSAQGEYDVLSHNTGYNTGRAGNGFLLSWTNLPLSEIGIPGRITRFNFARASMGEGDDGKQSFKDTGNYSTGIQIEPFTQVKNKWLSGLGFSFNAFFCNEVTTNTHITSHTPDYGCARNRIEDDGNGGRQLLFDSGTISGRGMNTFFMPGLSWRVGPYQIYGVTGFTNYASNKENPALAGVTNRGRNFLIGHQLFLWSPKGFLTGNPNTPGSVLFGTHFERAWEWCNRPEGAKPCAQGNQFSRERVLVREWDLFYFLAPMSSIGVNWEWWNASNLRTGFNQAGDNLGVCSGRSRNPCQYKSWHTVWLNWRMNF